MALLPAGRSYAGCRCPQQRPTHRTARSPPAGSPCGWPASGWCRTPRPPHRKDSCSSRPAAGCPSPHTVPDTCVPCAGSAVPAGGTAPTAGSSVRHGPHSRIHRPIPDKWHSYSAACPHQTEQHSVWDPCCGYSLKTPARSYLPAGCRGSQHQTDGPDAAVPADGRRSGSRCTPTQGFAPAGSSFPPAAPCGRSFQGRSAAFLLCAHSPRNAPPFCLSCSVSVSSSTTSCQISGWTPFSHR